MNRNYICMEGICKRFGNTLVLKNADLTLQAGECVAVTGYNGAGKSTLLRIAAGLTRYDKGTITYPKKIEMAYVPEHFPKMNITADSYIRHMGRIQGLKSKVLEDRMNALFSMFFMEDLRYTQMNNLSKGTLQKTAVIQALLKKADVMLLDEPLAGQDVKSQEVFIGHMNRLKQEGMGILLSCHEDYLIQRLADRSFEIREHGLKKMEIVPENREKYVILSFSAPSGERSKMLLEYNLPDFLAERECIQARMDGELLTVRLPRAVCDETILFLLQSGWSLEAML